jgi:transposase
VPIADNFRAWLDAQRVRAPDGSTTAKAIDYNPGRWKALTHYLGDGDLPCDSNWVENRIRPMLRCPMSVRLEGWGFGGSAAADVRDRSRPAAKMSTPLFTSHEPENQKG